MVLRGLTALTLAQRLLLPFLLYPILLVGNVSGFRCYECVETGDSSSDSRDSNSCMNVIPKDRTTSCLTTSSSPFCLKIDGIRDGQHVAVRVCASRDWENVLGGSNRCKDVRDINRRGRTEVKIDNGYVCICDSDKCNLAPQVKSSHLALGLSVSVVMLKLINWI